MIDMIDGLITIIDEIEEADWQRQEQVESEQAVWRAAYPDLPERITTEMRNNASLVNAYYRLQRYEPEGKLHV